MHVVDYDASSNRWFQPLDAGGYGSIKHPQDPYQSVGAKVLDDPRFHSQNVYAITMRTLAQFERALGRRVSWSLAATRSRSRRTPSKKPTRSTRRKTKG